MSAQRPTTANMSGATPSDTQRVSLPVDNRGAIDFVHRCRKDLPSSCLTMSLCLPILLLMSFKTYTECSLVVPAVEKLLLWRHPLDRCVRCPPLLEAPALSPRHFCNAENAHSASLQTLVVFRHACHCRVTFLHVHLQRTCPNCGYCSVLLLGEAPIHFHIPNC